MCQEFLWRNRMYIKTKSQPLHPILSSINSTQSGCLCLLWKLAKWWAVCGTNNYIVEATFNFRWYLIKYLPWHIIFRLILIAYNCTRVAALTELPAHHHWLHSPAGKFGAEEPLSISFEFPIFKSSTLLRNVFSPNVSSCFFLSALSFSGSQDFYLVRFLPWWPTWVPSSVSSLW